MSDESTPELTTEEVTVDRTTIVQASGVTPNVLTYKDEDDKDGAEPVAILTLVTADDVRHDFIVPADLIRPVGMGFAAAFVEAAAFRAEEGNTDETAETAEEEK